MTLDPMDALRARRFAKRIARYGEPLLVTHRLVTAGVPAKTETITMYAAIQKATESDFISLEGGSNASNDLACNFYAPAAVTTLAEGDTVAFDGQRWVLTSIVIKRAGGTVYYVRAVGKRAL